MPTGEVWEKIYKNLIDHVTAEGGERGRKILTEELLTPTERIMLAKRLAIICMIGEGYTFENIQETLRVSPSTVGRIWQLMQKGKYKRLIRVVRQRKVIDLITLFLPRPYTGPRWGRLL